MKNALLRGATAVASLVALVAIHLTIAFVETPMPPTPPTTDCEAYTDPEMM